MEIITAVSNLLSNSKLANQILTVLSSVLAWTLAGVCQLGGPHYSVRVM